MKLVITDLAEGGVDGATGHAIVPFEHIEGKSARADPPETIALKSIDLIDAGGCKSHAYQTRGREAPGRLATKSHMCSIVWTPTLLPRALGMGEARERKTMPALDPVTTPSALAVANSAIVLAIFDVLLAKGILNRSDISNAINAAMIGVGARAHSVEGAEALKMLQALLKDFPES